VCVCVCINCLLLFEFYLLLSILEFILPIHRNSTSSIVSALPSPYGDSLTLGNSFSIFKFHKFHSFMVRIGQEMNVLHSQ
jgi:hypothetical protein